MLEAEAVENEEQDEEQIRGQLIRLEQERIQQAKLEIQAILSKYNVELRAVATIPATEISIVPRRE